MRWLLVKDLQILRRSPLVTALLVIYPILIAVLIGFALSRGPERPRVAFLNEVPEDTPFEIGGEEFDVLGAREELGKRLDLVRVDDREEARELVEDGDVLGALILPEDLVDRLEGLEAGALEPPRVEVLVNEEDPLKAQLVDDRISALLTEANLRISRAVSDVTLDYLDLLIEGGTVNLSILGGEIDILGLARTEMFLREIRGAMPEGDPDAAALDQVIRFAGLARENLDFADELLSSVSQPIQVDKEVISGGAPSLDSFAISVAVTVTLMFVTVLLVAGSLALEREENAFSRLTRGLLSPTSLLGEKVVLGIVCSVAVTALLLAGLTLFVDIDWAQAPQIFAAVVAGGAGFAALGAAIGGAAREVRASSLLAFMISLPIAFLSLVPSGTVGPALFDAIEVVRSLFPFAPGREAMESALDDGGDLLVPLLHLAGLTLVYLVLARLAVRRFA
jgi:ABC-type transport system involved in cytochrome c biogenesis permease component